MARALPGEPAVVICRRPNMSKLSIRAKSSPSSRSCWLQCQAWACWRSQHADDQRPHVEIASSWLPSVRVLGELRTDINLFRIALRAHVMAETLDAKAANDKRLAGILERIAKDRKTYEPLISSPEERSIYENWSRAWDKYIAGVQEVIQLSRASVGRIPTEASEAISKKVAVIAAESDAFLEKSINLNNTGADTATRQAAEGYNFAFWTVLGIVAAMMVCGFGVGLYLVRDLSNGIASIVKPMQALGSGDLTAEVMRRGEKTEIGAMADALQVFKDALIAKKAADADAARDAEAKIERGRRVDSITSNFEAMIGEIVDTVSSASTELEASAGTLTSTAERAQELATTVASASEEASTNVQSVASATEEMASSVTEISRQVQESARMAGDAVDQARKDQRPGQRTVEGCRPHRRRGRTDQQHRGPDQSARPQRDHRGRACRRGRTWFRGRGIRGEGAGRTDRQGHRRDRPADHRHPGRDPGVGQRHPGDLAAPSEGCRKSPRRSRRPWKSRARRRRKSPATCSRRRRGPRWSPPTSPTCSAARPRPRAASSHVLSAAQSLSTDSNRLKVEVAKFLEFGARRLKARHRIADDAAGHCPAARQRTDCRSFGRNASPLRFSGRVLGRHLPDMLTTSAHLSLPLRIMTPLKSAL